MCLSLVAGCYCSGRTAMRWNARRFHTRIVSLLFVILAANLIAAPIPIARAATTWYVQPSGDDTKDCQTLTTACATIGGAIGKAASSDTINIAAGSYRE